MLFHTYLVIIELRNGMEHVIHLDRRQTNMPSDSTHSTCHPTPRSRTQPPLRSVHGKRRLPACLLFTQTGCLETSRCVRRTSAPCVLCVVAVGVAGRVAYARGESAGVGVLAWLEKAPAYKSCVWAQGRRLITSSQVHAVRPFNPPCSVRVRNGKGRQPCPLAPCKFPSPNQGRAQKKI